MPHAVPSLDTFVQVEVFTHWSGFSAQPIAAKLTIARHSSELTCERALCGPVTVPPADALARFFAALCRPPVSELAPRLFDLPEVVIRGHYGSCWTNDHPSVLVRVTTADSQKWEVCSTEQYAFMLPFQVRTPQGTTTTFDPELSRSIADLLPDEFPEKTRLSGRLGMLELDHERHIEETSRNEPANPEPPAAWEPPDPERAAEAEREIFRILFREESPEQKAEAERSGKISQRLLKRISLGDVRELIAAGADVNIADDVGQTALMTAAWPPFDQQKFRLLVAAGASVDARRNDGYTGLHLACSGGEALAAAEWVRAGADVNARTPEGHTPLMLAATWPEIVATLRRAGADVNAVDSDGHSALVCAILGQSWVVAENQLRAIQTLLTAGSDVNAKDKEGRSPLNHALGVLAREQLAEEVLLAFNPEGGRRPGREWTPTRLAERIVKLIRSAGGIE